MANNFIHGFVVCEKLWGRSEHLFGSIDPNMRMWDWGRLLNLGHLTQNSGCRVRLGWTTQTWGCFVWVDRPKLQGIRKIWVDRPKFQGIGKSWVHRPKPQGIGKDWVHRPKLQGIGKDWVHRPKPFVKRVSVVSQNMLILIQSNYLCEQHIQCLCIAYVARS
jgi:hypothetical protein